MPTDTPSRFAILGLLAREPLSGYALRQRFSESLANFWRLSFGQIYPLLHELEAEGLVAPVEGGEPAPRNRRAYRLTPSGAQALAAWIGEPPAFEQTRSELLLKLAFASSAPPGALRRHLEDFAVRQRARVAQLTTIAATLRRDHPASPEADPWLLTLDYGLTKARALADWADRAARAFDPPDDP
jgi:PadR family transcriptional regulator AphA